MAVEPRIRRARPDEATAITELTRRAKRHWGYSEAFMTTMAPVLTTTSAVLERDSDRVEVLDAGDRLLGFYRLRCLTELAFLEDLFVDPSAMGRGYGHRLFLRAATVARQWGKGVIELESDPFAEGFYLRLGAVRVAMSPSTLMLGRAVPLMRYNL